MESIKSIFIILIIVFAASGCSEDKVEPGTGIEGYGFVGKWNWISTEGGLAAHINETPQSTGKSVQLILTGNYLYSVHENGVEVSSGSYNITIENSIYSEENEPFLHLSDSIQIANVVLSGIARNVNDSILTISDNNYDGIGSTFRRAN